MTPYEFDDDPARFSTRLSLAVAAVAVLLLGLGTGPGLLGVAPATLLGLLGAWALVRGAVAIDAGGRRDRAVGSVWFVLGTLAAAAGVAAYKPTVAAAAVTAFGTLAVAVLGLSLTVGIDDGLVRSLGGSLSRSLVVLVAAASVTAGVHVHLFGAAAVGTVAVYAAVVGSSALVGFVALQLEVLALAVLADRATRVLDGWLPDRRFDRRESALRELGVRAGDVPRGVQALLVLEVLAASTGTGRLLFARLLAGAGPFGTVVRLFLRSWLPHALLAVGIVAFGSVVALRLCQRVVVRWVGREPPRTVAYAAGGVVVGVGVGVLTALPPVVWLVGRAVPDGSVLDVAFATYGMGTTLLGLATGALCALLVALPVCHFLIWNGADLEHGRGLTLGAALLLAAAFAAGFGDAPAVVAFLGVAATLATWDLAVNATLVGREVGRAAESRRGEVVHAAGVLAVGVVAVLVTLVGVEFIGAAALTLDVPRWRAVGALTLLLVALVCFAALAALDDGGAGGASTGDGDAGGDDGGAGADVAGDDGPPSRRDRWYTKFDDL